MGTCVPRAGARARRCLRRRPGRRAAGRGPEPRSRRPRSSLCGAGRPARTGRGAAHRPSRGRPARNHPAAVAARRRAARDRGHGAARPLRRDGVACAAAARIHARRTGRLGWRRRGCAGRKTPRTSIVVSTAITCASKSCPRCGSAGRPSPRPQGGSPNSPATRSKPKPPASPRTSRGSWRALRSNSTRCRRCPSRGSAPCCGPGLPGWGSRPRRHAPWPPCGAT